MNQEIIYQHLLLIVRGLAAQGASIDDVLLVLRRILAEGEAALDPINRVGADLTKRKSIFGK